MTEGGGGGGGGGEERAREDGVSQGRCDMGMLGVGD